MSRRRREARKVHAGRPASAFPPPTAVAPPTARYLASDGVLLRPVEEVSLSAVLARDVAPDLSTMTVAQLRERAKDLGVPLGKARTKAAIVEALGG